MAKRKQVVYNGRGLFDEQLQQHERKVRRQRALFIPKFLREAAASNLLEGEARDRAYQIILRWADLEAAGHLPAYKETSIDTQFLDQIFGEGLGYRVKTTSPEAWELEHKYFVKDVGTADAALGEFPKTLLPSVMVELKGAMTDLDRDRSNGRTAVQQCWDYLNAVPSCPWGIVSNFKTIRLYHREKGTLAYEEFSLQELRDPQTFNEFYCLFERGGLLHSRAAQQPRALELLQRTTERQKEVGDELYQMYQWQRWELIQHLYRKEGKSLDAAIRIAQKLLDRIIFIAFCEDRELLPENLLRDTEQDVRMYSRARNPQWESFLDLFTAIDKGAKGKREISAFNGGLFADDPEINSLELVADKWTNGFVGFGKYDFSEEVSVEVLGHLFERSITELEKLRVGGLIALEANIEGVPDSPAKTGKGKGKKGKLPRKTSEDELTSSKMTKSAERKRFGIYYTPPPFTGLIVERTVDALAKDRFAALARAHKVDPEARRDADKKRLLAYWTACLEALKSITVCDPACGSGAFLIRAYESLDAHYKTVIHGLAGAGMAPDKVTELEDSIPDEILSRNLFGVDLSQEAVEITQLALWIRSARKGKTLTDLSQNIIWGNSLVADEETVRLNYGRPDSKKQPKAMGWETVFPSIFASPRTGFDCVIGNPPWEQLMLYEREFFGLTAPNIASALNTADRGRLIAKLERDNPELFKLYETAKQDAERMQDYVQSCGHFPLTAKGRANTFALFAELACGIVNPHGRVGLLVPSGIATDTSTKEFFAGLMENNRLVGLYDFENRRHIFPDVDPRFKFCVLLFGGSEVKSTIADFVFFAHRMEDLQENYRHIDLSWKELSLFNPNSKTCPIFRSQRDAALTKSIYRRVPILIDKSRRKGGNPWGLRFRQGLFNQSSDSGLFKSREALNAEGFSLSGNRWTKHDDSFLALYEAKMVQAYDHRAASVVIDRSNWVRQGQTEETTLVYHQNPEFEVQPRYWVLESEVLQAAEGNRRWGFVVFKDITSATNTRTMIAAAIPWSAVPHPLPLVLTSQSLRLEMCLLANFNSIIYDFVSRQKVGGTHLTFFIVEQIPTLPPTTYSEKCPWAKRETLEHWISERVLKLSCTAEDMIPLAQACDFKGSRGDGVHLWKEEERAQLRAELDAAYFHLYGISREDAEYILSTFTNTGLVPADERPTQQLLWSPGSPGERILEAYDRQEK